MIFFIQASSPEQVPQVDLTEDDLREAIEDVFESDTEDAIMNWNGVSVAISYKYDLSVMIEDLIDMLVTILSTNDGETVVTWPSSGFRADWRLTWDQQGLACAATWHCVAGCVESHLSETGAVHLSREDFLAEWRLPLVRIVSALRFSGFNPSGLPGLGVLEDLLTQLPKPGMLYRRSGGLV